jgi:outer membrane receptor protein involved in Fe transport
MAFKKTKVCTAVLTLVGGALALPAVVQAQATAETAAPASVITVTGSRIKQLSSSSAPIAEVGGEEFTLTGTTRVEDLLNSLPQLSSSFDSFTVNPTVGFATADLRGLGTARTLVLVNGYRLQPGGIRSEARDLNQIPAALIKRVDILTGGASAVYGADAMAGVVNFILDTEFEGFSATAGWSGYQHKNEDSYIQGLMDQRNFSYPTGTSGPDGEAQNVDLAWGSRFADGKGHAMAYFTWRKNDELRQGARDYSSCALNAAGTSCGGSGTSEIANFLVFGTPLPGAAFQGGGARLAPDGSWVAGSPPPYNYAPVNHYQRPDERWTFGSSLKYEVNANFRPFVETMFANTNTSVQIAESGTFFANDPTFQCNDPLIGTLCADLGIDPADPVSVYIGKRNNEGGPRVSKIESNSFRVVAGAEGELGFGTWFYNASFLYGRNSSNQASINDFLISRLDESIRDGTYDIFNPAGVTAEQAAGLSGTGLTAGSTSLQVLNAYVSGDIGVTVPTAGDPISLVLGAESRTETYTTDPDANVATGNFTGAGGPASPLTGETKVNELFMEAQVPLFKSSGLLKSLDADLGYRSSDYTQSGNVNTYKIGANANFGAFRVRAGYNRAIRSASISDLFSNQEIALWSGSDPCSGATPTLSAAECANTGVTAAQYGSIQASPASQYNQFVGGNPGLKPEQGDTYTIGLVMAPIRGLNLSIDYYDIEITDTIASIGANTILTFCARTGDPFLCGKVRRNANNGDLWVGSNPATSGYVENLTSNFGDRRFRGLDIAGSYTMPLMGGQFTTSFSGTQTLEVTVAPLPGVNDSATYDCKGKINISCQSPEWRHTMSFRMQKDWWTANIRWRHVGEMDYIETDGSSGTTDQLLVRNGNKLSAFNYLDLSGSVNIGKYTTITAGVNNVADKAPPMVGSTLSLNGTSIGGYDQIGRYLFANVKVRF